MSLERLQKVPFMKKKKKKTTTTKNTKQNKTKQADIIEAFNSTSKYLDDLPSIQ